MCHRWRPLMCSIKILFFLRSKLKFISSLRDHSFVQKRKGTVTETMANFSEQIALSGGAGKSKFNVLGKMLSQQELMDLLMSVGFKNVSHKSNKKTRLLLIPDHVLDASDSSRQRASDQVQVQHISSFIKLHKLEPILQTKLFCSKSNTSSSSSLQTTNPTPKTASSKFKEHSVSQQENIASSHTKNNSSRREFKKQNSNRDDNDKNHVETNQSDEESNHDSDSDSDGSEEEKEEKDRKTNKNLKKTTPQSGKVYIFFIFVCSQILTTDALLNNKSDLLWIGNFHFDGFIVQEMCLFKR